MTDRRVLHVLPHSGGGGDTYVEVLSSMPGYAFTRVYLAPQRKAGMTGLPRGLAEVARRMRAQDLLHVHGEGAAALFLPLLALRPSVVTLHGLHLLRRVTGIRRRAAALNLRAVVRTANRTICVSVAEQTALLEATGRAVRDRTVVVHNGAHPPAATAPAERARVRAELGLGESEPVGLWVGALDERRDPLAVVRAAERTSTALLIAGDGPLRAQVEQAANAHVRVLGQRDDVQSLLAAADFFVLMSLREGLSFALVEAMAHGLASVIANIPENLEAVGDSGLAVPYGDEAAIASAMRRLTESSGERAALAERARRRAVELFDADVMIERTAAVYEAVLAE